MDLRRFEALHSAQSKKKGFRKRAVAIVVKGHKIQTFGTETMSLNFGWLCKTDVFYHNHISFKRYFFYWYEIRISYGLKITVFTIFGVKIQSATFLMNFTYPNLRRSSECPKQASRASRRFFPPTCQELSKNLLQFLSFFLSFPQKLGVKKKKFSSNSWCLKLDWNRNRIESLVVFDLRKFTVFENRSKKSHFTPTYQVL